MVLVEGFLQWVQRFVGVEVFDGGDGAVVSLDCEHRAAFDAVFVYVDGVGVAVVGVAADDCFDLVYLLA